MQLTLQEAAARLGKTPRQLRYLIQHKGLPAKKMGATWVVDSENLPLSPGQEAALARRDRQLRAAVEEAFELPAEGARPPRYSVRDLKTFQIALPLYRKATTDLGADHPAARALRSVLEHLARGCHRFERGDKAAAYREARDEASAAVCELVLENKPVAGELAVAIEQELMAAFAGLLRRVDRRVR